MHIEAGASEAALSNMEKLKQKLDLRDPRLGLLGAQIAAITGDHEGQLALAQVSINLGVADKRQRPLFQLGLYRSR